MKKKIILTLLIIFGFSANSFAGMNSVYPFDDLAFKDVNGNNRFNEYVINWYSEAAHFFKKLNIIQGIDGNFLGEKEVSRAELVVILKRYHDYMTNPMGIEWEQQKNAYYSVSYPAKGWSEDNVLSIEDCDSSMRSAEQYYYLNVNCINSEEMDIENILKSFEADTWSNSYEEFVLNGNPAWKVTRVNQRGEAEEYVIVKGKEKIYKLGGAFNLNDLAFETFYRSFKPL